MYELSITVLLRTAKVEASVDYMVFLSSRGYTGTLSQKQSKVSPSHHTTPTQQQDKALLLCLNMFTHISLSEYMSPCK